MISISDLTVSYGSWNLLDHISFHISERDKIGLVGKIGRASCRERVFLTV